MAISATTLATRFCIELREELDDDTIAKIVRRNKSEGFIGTGACASHDFCDANQVMLNALAMLGVSFDAEDGEQAAWMDEAWTIARMLDFDEVRVQHATYLKEYEPKPKPLDPLDEAQSLAAQLCNALVFSNREVRALLQLHLLPLIAKAAELKHTLDVLQDAIKQDA